jgi:hypothetical protein
MFYRDNVKIIPHNLDEYLTPLALSTLFLSAGRPEERGVNLPKSCVLVEDLKDLSLVLKKKYNIDTIINNSNLNDGKYSSISLHIKNSSFSTFSNIIKPYLLHSQYHLLKRPILKLTFPGSNGIHNHSYIPKRDLRFFKKERSFRYKIYP